MEKVVIIVRFLLPIIGLSIVLVTKGLIKPPKRVFNTALMFCWVAGVTNFVVDIFEKRLGFWHYTANHLLFGYPFDLYIAVSLVIGLAIPILYWWLQNFYKSWALFIILILNVYFVVEDSVVFRVAGNAAGIRDSIYWWVADFISIAAIIWISLFVFNYSLNRER